MKTMKLFLFIPLSLLLTGCAASRTLSGAALAGGGAALAHELSNGDPLITAAGAAGGFLVSEGVHLAARKHAEKAYQSGYEKGRSDAVKQQYWILVNQQKSQSEEDNIRLYEIPLPEQRVDGVILNPTTKYLRIEE
jgi:hypothetical protein